MRKIRAFAILAAMAIAAVSSHAQEPSVHQMPAGTVLRDKFVLVGKTVPLPEGDFVLVATRAKDATHVKGEWIRQRVQLVTAYLVQLEGDQLRAEVTATTVLDPRFTYSKWEDEPCTRSDTVFRLDRGQNAGYQQNCLLVNHITNIYTRHPEGIYGDAYLWLQQHGARLPVDVVIQATVTRIEIGEWLSVTQRFNPAAFGCDVGRNPSWATSAWHRSALAKDPERAQFVESVVAWGKVVQTQVDNEIRKRGSTNIDRPGAQIYRCQPKSG